MLFGNIMCCVVLCYVIIYDIVPILLITMTYAAAAASARKRPSPSSDHSGGESSTDVEITGEFKLETDSIEHLLTTPSRLTFLSDLRKRSKRKRTRRKRSPYVRQERQLLTDPISALFPEDGLDLVDSKEEPSSVVIDTSEHVISTVVKAKRGRPPHPIRKYYKADGKRYKCNYCGDTFCSKISTCVNHSKACKAFKEQDPDTQSKLDEIIELELGKQTKEKLRALFAKAVISNGQALHPFYSPQWIEFFTELGFKLPAREKVNTKYLNDVYVCMLKDVFKCLQAVPHKVSLCVDQSSDGVGYPVEGYVVCAPEPLALSLSRLHGLKKTTALSYMFVSKVLGLLSKHGISPVAIVTDNEAKTVKLRREIGRDYEGMIKVPCFAHWLHNVVKHYLSGSEIKTVVEELNSLCTRINKGSVKQFISTYMKRKDRMGTLAAKDMKWGIKFSQYKQVWSMSEALKAASEEDSGLPKSKQYFEEKHRTCIDSDVWWSKINSYYEPLSSIVNVLHHLQGDSVSLSHAFISVYNMNRLYKKREHTLASHIEPLWDHISTHGEYYASYVFDCNMWLYVLPPEWCDKAKDFLSDRYSDIWGDEHCRLFKQMIQRSGIFGRDPFATRKKTCKPPVAAIRDSSVSSTTTHPRRKRTSKKEAMQRTSYSMWYECYSANTDRFIKEFCVVAMELLSIPPTQAACERVYKSIKVVDQSHRRRLGADTMDRLVLVHANRSLIPKFLDAHEVVPVEDGTDTE